MKNIEFSFLYNPAYWIARKLLKWCGFTEEDLQEPDRLAWVHKHYG